ncbi:Eco57I restriction-modification methylase domain-containing protein [Wukongibacter sp. M2B1]|uniref:Eco57I restriction-modification methylase domain-containing protein n=1 Tax=Wukongibacter sp. M2B1 TaxID=3088895 RepID=UPI003D78D05E
MEKSLVKALDNILANIDTGKDNREEVFINLIRENVLRKNGIKLNDYLDFLHRHFGSLDFIAKDYSYLDAISKDLTEEMDLMMLCGILEEYMNNQKRELTGSYYTPVFIIELIVSNSIILYLKENIRIDEDGIEKLVKDKVISNIDESQLIEILNILKEIKIIDIACGSGLFLHHTLEIIYNIKAAIYRGLKLDIDQYEEKKWILENNIYGIDIQLSPLEMIALKYIDMFAEYEDFSIDSLSLNFYLKNSILGEEIFMEPEISKVIDRGGFDIVIGNPPYVGEKGNKELFEDIKKYEFGKKYYEAKMDYFYYFIYRGIDILKDGGVLSYITTNYFITADGAKKLRRFFKYEVSFSEIINFNEYEVFKAAKGQHNIIFTITKGADENKPINVKYVKNHKLQRNEINELINNKEVNNDDVSNYMLDNQQNLYESNGNIMIFPNGKYSEIIKKIKSHCDLKLGNLCNVNQGIVSGADKVTARMIDVKLKSEMIKKYNINVNEGIFVLNKEEISNNQISNCKLLKPFYKNSDIKKYFTNKSTDKFILYFTDKNISNDEFCFVIQEHLRKYKDIMELRRETKKGIRKWFALQWSRDQSIFEGPKIVVPHRAIKNNFGYNVDPWYASADVYFITTNSEKVDIKLLLGILNSKVTYFWLYNMGKRKGNYLELYSSPLLEIPINLKLDCSIREKIINMTDEILDYCEKNYNWEWIEEYQSKIDREIYKAFHFTKEEIEIIEELYFG